MEISSVKTVDINNIKFSYFNFGNGKKNLIILPGLSLTSVMISSVFIANSYKCFAQNYTVYVFDYPDIIPDNYSAEEISRDLINVFGKVGIKNASVFGTSMGGMIAQKIALNSPDTVTALILGSTFCRINDKSKAMFESWIEFAGKGNRISLNRSFFKNVYSEEYYTKNKDAFEMLEDRGTKKELDRFIKLTKMIIDFNVYEEIKSISCPVLVIGSENDKVLGVEGSFEISKKIGCEKYIYSGYSHAVYDEAPDYKQRMLDFLRTLEIN